jgi:hypothetical protein
MTPYARSLRASIALIVAKLNEDLIFGGTWANHAPGRQTPPRQLL